MSYQVFFAFSQGLSKPLQVPLGTKARIQEHVRDVEEKLGLKRTRYKDNQVHWDHRRGYKRVDDKMLCQAVEAHNDWVRWTYRRFAQWAEQPVADGETLTPEDAATFWHALELLEVPLGRWTPEYYHVRMNHLYEVMRGREHEGVTFDAKKLTPEQAGAVVRIFSHYLDVGDRRLEVPHGRDYLASSYDGGYDWCASDDARPYGCFRAIAPGDEASCRRRKCPLREKADA